MLIIGVIFTHGGWPGPPAQSRDEGVIGKLHYLGDDDYKSARNWIRKAKCAYIERFERDDGAGSWSGPRPKDCSVCRSLGAGGPLPVRTPDPLSTIPERCHPERPIPIGTRTSSTLVRPPATRNYSVGCLRPNRLCTIRKPVLPSKAALNLPDRLIVPCRKRPGKIPMTTRVLKLSGLFVIIALTYSFAASAQSRSKEESAVQDAYKAYVQAWKTKDLAALEKLISPDYMAVNFEGKLSTREIELATAKSDSDWVAMDVDEIHTRIWGDTAVASGFISAQGKKPDGSSFNARVRFLAMLVKQDGRWQLVATQSSSFKKP